MSDTLRLFFALPVPPAQARKILSWRQQLPCSGNWVHGHDLHLAPSCPPTHLLQLQQDLAEQLQQLGFALEQPTYRPHLTLARHASWPSTAPGFGFRWHVDRFALFTSKSVTIGPRYQQIGTWQLV